MPISDSFGPQLSGSSDGPELAQGAVELPAMARQRAY